jgi:hypothetical protein
MFNALLIHQALDFLDNTRFGRILTQFGEAENPIKVKDLWTETTGLKTTLFRKYPTEQKPSDAKQK